MSEAEKQEFIERIRKVVVELGQNLTDLSPEAVRRRLELQRQLFQLIRKATTPRYAVSVEELAERCGVCVATIYNSAKDPNCKRKPPINIFLNRSVVPEHLIKPWLESLDDYEPGKRGPKRAA